MSTAVFLMIQPAAATYLLLVASSTLLKVTKGPLRCRWISFVKRTEHRAGLRVNAQTAEMTTETQRVTANCR